ncbi:putative protein C3orf67 -like protein [Channa argus]|uniref:CFA20 domain-containing protein n=1 Tax=Channa argus TaxID=215402 RepID=A0A6G1PIX5_CHAAH|nr:putative protein C3orf67 -like protein [Channa argus]
MFRNNYQGGAVVEIFSGQGKDPVAKWKLCGGPSAIRKWSTLCIDLVSFTAELFKGFLTLDGITLFATCKVRRIFTMKTEPTGMSADDMFLSGAGLTDLIPRSCQFPPDVTHVTQLMNMANLQKAETSTNPLNSDVVPDQSGTARSSSYRRARPQGVSHTASGSRASGPPPPTGRKSSAASDRMNNSALFISDMGSPSIRMNQKVSAESPSIANLCKNFSHRAPSCTHHEDMCSFSPLRETSRAAPTPAESLSCSIQQGLSSDLRVWSSWECNEGPEPQLTLQEEVFTFSSHPHSPKRGQDHGDQEKLEMVDDQVQSRSRRRHEAQPEDDFIGSESDEDKTYTTFQHQRTGTDSSTATPRSPGLTLNTQHDDHVESHNMHQTSRNELSAATINMLSASHERGEPARMGPTRCLSPAATPSRQCGLHGTEIVTQVLKVKDSVSLSRRLLQEVKMDNFPQHKEEDDDETLKAVDSSHYEVDLLGSLQMHGDDDEELQMLASLKREQEEDECRASGLSASQIHQCNVSISMSSDDTSTWTHISMAGIRVHPGIIASVIFVAVAAIAAAVLIIRKYCFPVNEATYRYSVLRRMEDQGSVVTEEDGDRGPGTVGEESDETPANEETQCESNCVLFDPVINEVAALRLSGAGTRFTGHVEQDLTLHLSFSFIMWLCASQNSHGRLN